VGRIGGAPARVPSRWYAARAVRTQRAPHRLGRWPAAALPLALAAALTLAALPFPALTPAGRAQSPVARLVPLATGLAAPVLAVPDPAGNGRLFVVEQRATIRIVDATGAVLPTPFLDISDRVVSGGEQGLLGLAFHPAYRTNGVFYVYYTARPVGASVGDNTLVRGRAASDDAADRASLQPLFAVPDPYANHNGGMLAFGPDGFL